jgi:GNAT superfamily N-acetyltransferase
MSEDDLSAITFAVIEEKSMPADLDRKIREILVECFPHNTDHYSQTRDWHCSPAWVVIATAPDGAMAAHCAMVEREVAVGGNTHVTVAGVQGFSVRPPWRKAGLSDRIMAMALTEARRRGIQAGLLFCLPSLERVYRRMGWRTAQVTVTMLDENGKTTPLPEKNIAMVIPLTIDAFPDGDIDLRGTDW